MVWLGSSSNHHHSPAKKAMVFALFRRNHGVHHSKLKEEKISLVQQQSHDSSYGGSSSNHRHRHHESNISNIRAEIFEDDDGTETRDEEWGFRNKNNNSGGRRDSSGSESRHDSAIAALLPLTPKRANNSNGAFPRASSTSSSIVDNKDAIIEALKEKCKTLRDKVLQYGDVDNYSESETAMKLEKEKYKLKKELKVVKSQLKFTNTALEDAVQKLQDHSLEKATMAETIDNQTDELHDFRLKCELLEKEVRELKRQLDRKGEVETSSSGSSDDDSMVDIVVASSSSSSSSSNTKSEEARKLNKNEGERKTKTNPFDDESTVSTYRNPFNDDTSTQSPSQSTRNPFGNNENVNTDRNKHLEVEEAMKKELADLQAKYAQKMASQLSKIASLQEENDIKDIQLKNLQEKLDKLQATNPSNSKLRFGSWMRNDTNTKEEPTAEIERV